jgi:hypothetical protein
MRRNRILTAAVALFAIAATVALYLSRLMTEGQCGRLNGAIDYEGRVCIIHGVDHPLREASIRLLLFWGIVAIAVSGASYGISRLIVAWRRGVPSDGAA